METLDDKTRIALLHQRDLHQDQVLAEIKNQVHILTDRISLLERRIMLFAGIGTASGVSLGVASGKLVAAGSVLGWF